MTVRWLDPREQRAWRSLMIMQEDLAEFLDRKLRQRSGLSRADYEVLAHLSEAPESRLRSFELGALLRWEKSRLSQHLGRMQNRGLVTRSRYAADPRGAVVAITPEGRERVEDAAPGHVADARDVLVDHLSEAEMEVLIRVGDKVRQQMERLGRGRIEGEPRPGAGSARPDQAGSGGS